MSLRYVQDAGSTAMDDSPSPKRRKQRRKSVRPRVEPSSPAGDLALPSLQENSMSMLMDTSLGDMLSRRQQQQRSPMRNIAFSTDLRRISEAPAIEEETQLLGGVDGQQLEQLALELMEIEARTKKRQAKSRQADLSALDETAQDMENAAPFVQLARGRGRSPSRSPSRSPQKATPSPEKRTRKALGDATNAAAAAAAAAPAPSSLSISPRKKAPLAPTKSVLFGPSPIKAVAKPEKEQAKPTIPTGPSANRESPSKKMQRSQIKRSPTKTKIPRRSIATAASERPQPISKSQTDDKQAPASAAPTPQALSPAKPKTPVHHASDPAPLPPSEQTPTTAPQASAEPLPSPKAKTERRRSARLSLKLDAVQAAVEDKASPPAQPTRRSPLAKAKTKAQAQAVRRAVKPSLTIPTVSLTRKESAIQRSASAQVRKETAAPVPPSTTVGGRTLRNRQSLSAPAAVPTTVIGGKFRQTSSGELVPVSALSGNKFTLSTDARAGRQPAPRPEPKTRYKANPIPDWMRKRRAELEREEEARLAREVQEARQAELTRQPKRRVAESSLKKAPAVAPTIAQPFVSSLDRRLEERQRWEERRRTREELLEAERAKARREREMEEEEEYKEARKRSVVKANPVPAYLRCSIDNGKAATRAGKR